MEVILGSHEELVPRVQKTYVSIDHREGSMA